MKLELKHLAPYLPYGLEVKITEEGNLFENEIHPVISMGLGDYVTCIVDEEDGTDSFDLNQVKPILRPLSDLTKEIEQEFKGQFTIEEYRGETILNEWKTKQERQEDLWMSYNGTYESYPYNVVEWLFSKHCDVFGLIEAGLAIDINKIKS